MADMEVLDSTPRNRTHRRWPWIVLTVLAVLVFAGWQINSWQQDRARADLTVLAESAEAAIERGESSIQATVAYASPLLRVGPPEVKAQLEELVLTEVSRARINYERERQQIEGISIPPWQSTARTQKATVLATLDERARTILEATGQGLADTRSQTSGN
jgi:Tfp pilus assembly protein PilX